MIIMMIVIIIMVIMMIVIIIMVIMMIVIITRLRAQDDVNILVDELFAEEIVPEPIPTTQVEIVHVPTIIPNVPSLGLVLPMAPKTRKMFHEVHDVCFESCQRIAI